MRLSFDGLAGMVKSYFSMNAASGHLFVFFSRRRDRMKILFADSEGFVLYYKRLERGTFSWLDELDLNDAGEMEASDFAIILATVNPVSAPVPRKGDKKIKSVPPLQLV
jgi:transposase